jgi:tRNA/rRNA methyltransferase
MTVRIDSNHVTVVLHKPLYPENIGAAARAMCNMGFHQLAVVSPRDCDLSRVVKMATRAALDVVEQMTVFDSLSEALAPFQFVVGTTARLGRQRQVIDSPAQLAQRLIPVSRENHIALLFGPEDRGLTNEDLRSCQWLVNIPTAEFSSLNLAQAVMIICYELFRAERENATAFTPRLANRHEMEGMYEQVKDILVRINYINPENPDYWMNNLRRFFTRMQLRAKEVSIIRGICRQFYWYTQKRYRDGLNDGRKQSDGSGPALE